MKAENLEKKKLLVGEQTKPHTASSHRSLLASSLTLVPFCYLAVLVLHIPVSFL